MSFANPKATRCETGAGVQASGVVVSTLGGLAKWTEDHSASNFFYFFYFRDNYNMLLISKFKFVIFLDLQVVYA